MISKLTDFPKDVVFEIMSRVPPDSLILFKLLSKSWYALIKSLINDPSFVAKQLHNVKNDMSFSTSLAFLCLGSCTCTSEDLDLTHSPSCFDKELVHLLTLFPDDSENDHIHHIIRDFNLPFFPGRLDVNGTIACHCNGLICLASDITGYENRIILCNPAIKESRLLPEPVHLDDFKIMGRGLGYDSRAKTYKFVIFGLDDKVQKTRAKIYSLDTNAWREIALHFTIDSNQYVDDVVYCKGVLYWVISCSRCKILSFDVSNEVFHFLTLPENLQALAEPQSQHWICLTIWNESVALLSFPVGGVLSIQVWAMDNCVDGVEGTWIKKLTVGPLVGLGYPLIFCQDELLMKHNNRGLISYNLRTKKLRNLAINGMVGIPYWSSAYVQSLVSVTVGSRVLSSVTEI